MGALDDTELLTSCCSFLLPKIDTSELGALRMLMISGSTVAVNSLRAFRLQRAIIAVGMFSMFEASLQTNRGWNRPFDVLKTMLKEKDLNELAMRFEQFQLAINVLKHGDGPSLSKLLEHKESLEFRVKKPNDWFEEEGDVSEGQFLVDADADFVSACANIITDINQILASAD